MKIFGIYTRVKEFLRRLGGNDKQITAESIQEQIPYYLTQEAKDGLVKALAYVLHFQNRTLQKNSSHPPEEHLRNIC